MPLAAMRVLSAVVLLLPCASAWKCPVCGLSYNASTFAEKPQVKFHGDQAIAIGGDGPLHIGGGCVKKFNENPAAYLSTGGMLPFGDSSRAGQNVTCPVSGESFIAPADEDAHVVQFNHGQVVYVCCPGCIEKLKANLTHYIDSLPKVSAPVNSTFCDGVAANGGCCTACGYTPANGGRCVSHMTKATTPYCKLLTEPKHSGCCVACGHTWSAAKGKCLGTVTVESGHAQARVAAGEDFCQRVEDNEGCCPACGYKWTKGKCVTHEAANITPYCETLKEPKHSGCCVICGHVWSADEGKCVKA